MAAGPPTEERDHALRASVRASAAASLDRKAPSIGCSRMRWRRSSWPTGSASITSGRSSITSSRSMRTPRRRRSSSPPAPRAPSSIRIGHGVVLAPPGYNHPARVAERIATLDLISDGRVDWGTGESASRVELEGFGIDPDQKKAMWAEAVEQTANMMAMSPYPGFAGKFFSMPVRNVVPEAAAEAASADLGRVQQARDHPCRGAGRHRRAHLRLRRSGRGRQVGARVLRHHQERPVRADRPHGERQRRHGDRLLRATRIATRRAAAAPRASSSSAIRSATTTSTAITSRASPTSGSASRRPRTSCRPSGRAAASARRPSSPSICEATRTPASTRSCSSSRAAATSTSTSASR